MQAISSYKRVLLYGFWIAPLFWVAQPTLAGSAQQVPIASASQASSPSASTSSTQIPLKTPDYSQQAYVLEKYATAYSFHDDGTGEALVTVVVRVQSQAGIQQFGNIAIPYEADSQRAEFPYVRVRKPDGSVVATPSSNVQDTAAPVTLQAPMYSDLRIKQIPVSNLNPGDTLEYQIRLVRTRAQVPNQFWFAQNFFKAGIVLEESVSLRFPQQKHVQVASADVQPSIHQDGGDTVYEWKTSHLQDEPTDKKATVSPIDSKPSIQVTTFENWQQVGEWYRSLQSDRVVVTPAIQQEEQELTRGLTTDEAKQRAIYSYVSTQFRYIGLSFGIGRYQPHVASKVFEDKFGDCKDKHTVFAALMKAAGYEVWPALIGSGKKLDAAVPYPGQFDHVISVVPQGKDLIWLDTTEEVAPFGMLAGVLRDKQALVMPPQGQPALMKTPIDPPFPEADIFTMKAALDSKAVLTGHVDLTARGDWELGLRAAFHLTPHADWTKLWQNVSYLLGFAGDVSQVQAGNPDDTTKPFHLDYDYTRKDYGGSDGKQISPPLPPIQFTLGENDKKPKDTIPLGAPGERDYRATIDLPRGDIATLSEDKDISTDFAEYKETSSVKDGVLMTERNLKVKEPQLPAAKWDDYLKFVKAVQDRENLTIPISINNGTADATGVRYSPAAGELVDQAYQAIQQNRMEDAKDELKQAQAMNPTQWGLAATYGDLYWHQNELNRAIVEYQKEVVNHPDNLRAARALAGRLMTQRRNPEAIEVWKRILQQDPEDTVSNQSLAYILMQQKNYGEAIALLKKVANGKNGNTATHALLGMAELDAGQKEAGIAELRKAMITADEPIMINNAAYELANHDADLKEAAQFAQKALQQIEDSASKTTLAALTNEDLQQVTLLAGTWDTVGWIDFKQAKYADAERYEHAAWLLEQHPDVADHLGQIYQKEGKPSQAAHMYRVALAAGPLENAPQVKQRLEALDKNATGTRREDLSALRTVEIHGLPRKMATAQFYVLLSPHGVEDVQFLSGSDTLRSASATLMKTDYGQTFPDSGPEKIARRVILSCSPYNSTCQLVLFLPQTVRR